MAVRNEKINEGSAKFLGFHDRTGFKKE